MKLRTYQQEIKEKLKLSIKSGNKYIFVQSATGSGKSIIFSSIISTLKKDLRAWVIVPRNELLNQSSKHFQKWKIPHTMIKPNRNELKSFKISIVSKDTLMRRLDNIKYPPDLIIFDEAHLYLDQQLKIKEYFPDAYIIGFSATPERLDGRGLNELYQDIIYGPSIPYLTECGFLSPIKYFAPPLDGLEKLKKIGSDYKESDLESLLLRRHVYGQAIEHYRKYAHKKPGIVFCRSVKAAYETAQQFRDAGYNCECIEGNMTDKQRSEILQGLANGKIDLITNCELVTYGLDIPNVEVGIILRPTLSKALYFQMIGRLLRIFHGKKEAIIFDHVNNLTQHADERYPDLPPFYVDDLQWNFKGKKKKKLCISCKFSELKSDYCKKRKQPVTSCKHYRKIEKLTAKLCDKCFLYYSGPKCTNCGYHKEKKAVEVETVPDELKIVDPVALKDRPIEEQRVYQDNINELIDNYQTGDEKIRCEAVKRAIEISKSLGRNIMWVYHKLNDDSRLTVNITLLNEIARQGNYKPGWAWYQKKRLEGRR